MTPIKLRIVSDDGIEATISCDGRRGADDDFHASVSVNGVIENKKIYGVDPLQSLVLGLKLVDELTQVRRLGGDDPDPSNVAAWGVEVDSE